MRDTKYIIIRILISVGIALILTMLRKYLFINVYALEIENDTRPIIYVPKGQTFTGDINKNPISYNYDLTNSTPIEIRTITGQSSTKLYPSLQEDYPYYAVNITNKNNFNQQSKYYTLGLESNQYLEKLTFTTFSTSGEYLKKDTKYTILIKITKPNEVKYYDNNNKKTNIENVNLNYFTLMAQEGAYQTDITNNIEITKFQYIKGLNSKAGGENPQFSNESFILIEYTTKENLEEDTYRLTNQTISFSINKWDFIEGEDEYFFKNDKYFLENDTNQEQEIKYNFVFMEGGYVEFCGIKEKGLVGCGRYFGNDLDKVTTEDQAIIDEYETCNATDIPCHLRNLLKGITNIFVRLGNGIKELFQGLIKGITDLFTPDFESMGETFGELGDLLQEKTGFLWESLDIFIDIINRFLRLNGGEVIIHIPNIEVPNFNFTIIPEQNWNLSGYFESGSLKSLYDTYKLLISGIFIMLFIDHAKMRIGQILNMWTLVENGEVKEEK